MVALWIIIILAIVQGFLEWLPVSSEGQLILILNWLGESETALSIALFLHLGTMLAVIIRFRKDFVLLFNFKLWKKRKEDHPSDLQGEELLESEQPSTGKNPETAELTTNAQSSTDTESSSEPIAALQYSKREEQKILWKFLLLAILATAVIGVPLYLVIRFALEEGAALEMAEGKISGGDIITMVIGLFLIGTGIFILVSRKRVTKKSLLEMTTKEMLILGAAQGFTIIPGVSRSGTTIGTMLIEGVREEEALRGSFLLSVPTVIGANLLILIIDLIQGEITFAGIPWYGMILAVIIAGIVGYLTIDLFLWVARKVNFGWFCILLGVLALLITIIIIILAVTTITSA